MTALESHIRWFEPPVADGIGRLSVTGASDAHLAEAVRSAGVHAGLRGLLVMIGDADADTALASHDFQAVCSALASLRCTTVATVSGPATGKYLELALACDYRLAADGANVVLGLPEVSMGLIPSGGGTQRLPRLIGLTRALDLILRGRRLNALQGRRVGLLDAVAPSGTLDELARAWARKPKHPGTAARRGGLIGLAERTGIGRRVIFERARRAIPRRYPAPLRALEVIELGYKRGIAAGLAAETKAIGELAVTPTTRSLAWLSGTEHQHRARFRGDGVPRLAVVSGSAMGAALSELLRGSQVALADADLIVVAARDDLEHHRAAVREVEASVRPQAVIAVHTSALTVTDIASSAAHPERIVGTRFIAPVQRTRLLEVVRHARATEAAAALAAGLGSLLDKTVIVVGDGPGFFISRVLGLMLNEAALLVDEGVRVDVVDVAMTRFGFAAGPLRLLDEIGLDVAQRVAELLELDTAFGDRMPRSRVIAELVAAGCVGRKSGAGFYLWRGRSPLDRVLRTPRRVPNPAAYRHAAPSEIDEATVQTRLALLLVNECIRCLEDGVLRSSADGDLGAVLGLGFPPFLGGPFHYADSLGLPVLVDKLKSLADQHGTRFAAAALLPERARGSRVFRGAAVGMRLDNYYTSNRDLAPLYTDVPDAAASWREVLSVAGDDIGHHVAARAAEVDRLGTPPRGTEIQVSLPMAENVRGLADLGLMGLSVPPDYGGIGAPFVVSGAVFEMLARADASTMMLYAFCVAPAAMILRFGSDEQKRRWVPELASGRMTGWVAMTEPEAGSDIGNISTTATPQADGTWRISGRKQFISSGNGQVGVLLARVVPDSGGLDGLGLFVVPRCVPDADFGEIENFRVLRAEAKVGLNGSPTCALSFEDSQAEILGSVRPGEGWRQITMFMNEARIVVAIQACGIAQASLSAAQAYAAQRVQMHKPIREHPLVAEMLLDMETSVAALRALWMEAAVAYDLVVGLSDRLERLSEADPERPAIAARRRRLLRYLRELMPLAKYFAAEEAIRITRIGMQVFGGYGVVKDYDVERFFRDSLALPIYEGASQIQALMATKDLLKTMLRDPRSLLTPGGHSPWLAEARLHDRGLRGLYRRALGDFSSVMRWLLVDLARQLGPRGILQFLQTRGELLEADLEYVLLSAERVTQMLAYLHVGRLLAQQAERWPERRPLARRFLQRTSDMCALTARRITRGDREPLEAIRQWRADTTDATTRSN